MSAQQTADELKNATLRYYDGKDYFPSMPLNKTGAYDTLKGLKYVTPLVTADGTVIDYVYSNPAESGAGSDIGTNPDSNTEASTADSSYTLQIPSSATDYTGDTMAIKSAVALSTLAGTIPFGGGIVYVAGMGVANILTANLLGKIIGESLYTDNPTIFTLNTIAETLGQSYVDGLTTKDGKAPIYYLFDKLGNFVPYVQEELIPALTFYQHKKNLFKEKTLYTFPTGVHGEKETISVTQWEDDISLFVANVISDNGRSYHFDDESKEKLHSYFAEFKNKACYVSLTNVAGAIYGRGSFSIFIYDSLTLGDNIEGKWQPTTPLFESTLQYSMKLITGLCRASAGAAINVSDVTIEDYTGYIYIGRWLEGAFNSQSSINVNKKIEQHIGISDQTAEGTKVFDDTLTDDDTPETTLTKLKDQYPDVFSDENTLKKAVVQPDGTVKEIKLVKVSYPVYDGTEDKPTTTETIKYVNQVAPAPDISTLPDNIIDKINKTLGDKSDPTTPSISGGTGTGTTPESPLPSQAASALWKWYNPTTDILNSFGAYLWSTDFLDNVKKLMFDPMQAVIGLKKIYMTPHTGGSENIKVGFLDSGVASPVCDTQYVTTVCGKVDLREFFGNVFDYSPYTKINLYLPFIGIVPLNPADVMRSTIQIVYKGDIVNGCCIAEVNVQRDGAGGTVYTYTGNMACEYPLTAGSYTGVISSIFSVAAGTVAGLSTGIGFNPIGLATGAGSSALSALAGGNMLNVQQSGSFAGTAGAMANKKPYLIISRPQSEINTGFPTLHGYPSNTFTTLSACSGYTQVKAVHVDSITDATQEEKEMIENALKSGVII